jgi:putative peptide zinc metalloprotease protein
MFLVFFPLPYVDASSAWSFASKWHRALVGMAGVLAELAVAAIAAIVWAQTSTGTVHIIAYNVIFVASVSTLLFNGNPLLRYDAYYILADVLEIPNLGPRGIRYIAYLMQRYVLAAKDVEPPFSAPGERVWFVIYTIAAFFYRIFVYASIILFIASKFFFVGVLIACWGAFNMLVMPLFKIVRFLVTSPKLRRKRVWALTVSSLILAAVLGVVTLVPVPLSTRAEGVIWIPEKTFVRAATDGFIEKVLVEPGSRIHDGQAVVECYDPLLPAQIRVLESRLKEMQALYDTQRIAERVKAEITLEEIQQVQAELADARRRRDELTIRSGVEGLVAIPRVSDLPGKFLRRGQLVGYVLNRSIILARVVVEQADVDFVRHRTRNVRVRFPENIASVYPARLLREVPAATDRLPSPTLSREGGGEIAIDPREPHGIKAFQKIFLFDVQLPPPEGLYNVGGRVYVRFDHGREPLIWRWYRSIRRLFLKRFNI